MKRRLTLSVAVFLGCTSSEAPNVAAPPAIVFDWLRNGNRDIYRAALDGKDTVRLTSDPGDDQHPTERAGTVVFTSYRDGHGQLSLTAGFGFAGSVEASPSWAPGSDRLVFVSTAGGTAGLYIIDVAGGTPTPLVVDTSANVEPTWSPDGRLVAFASDRVGLTNIFTVDVVTLQIRPLTADVATAGQPTWLADGRLVYTSWSGGTPRLRWRDPTADSAVNIDLGAGDAQHASAMH